MLRGTAISLTCRYVRRRVDILAGRNFMWRGTSVHDILRQRRIALGQADGRGIDRRQYTYHLLSSTLYTYTYGARHYS